MDITEHPAVAAAIEAVLAEAMTGDYAHLLATILDVTE